MKIWLLIFAFATPVSIGAFVFLKYKRRKVFFENLNSFCNYLLIEIGFSKNTIRSVIGAYSSGFAKPFNTVLSLYTHLLDEKQDITRQSIDSIFEKAPFAFKLKNDEIKQISDFFYELGRHGGDEEHEKIKSRQITFDTFLHDAQSAVKKDASMWLKLSILVGITAVILLF